MVATSNDGAASAAIGVGGLGASGISHAVSGVARRRVSGKGGPPCVHVPLMLLPSAASFPSKLAPAMSTAILNSRILTSHRRARNRLRSLIDTVHLRAPAVLVPPSVDIEDNADALADLERSLPVA